MLPFRFPRYPPLRFQRGDNVCRAPLARCPAEAFWVEDITDPRDTRALLCAFTDLAAPLRTPWRAAFGMRP